MHRNGRPSQLTSAFLQALRKDNPRRPPPIHAQVAPGGPSGIWWILTTRRVRGDYAETYPDELLKLWAQAQSLDWSLRSQIVHMFLKIDIPVNIDDLNYAHIITYATKNHSFCML